MEMVSFEYFISTAAVTYSTAINTVVLRIVFMQSEMIWQISQLSSCEQSWSA